MYHERRFGRRSVALNLVKRPPQNNNEKVLRGPKKKLFVDDESFVMKRTIPPLDKFNNFSIYKPSSHENLCEINTNKNSTLSDVYKKHGKIPLPSRKIVESSMKNHRESVIQSKELFNTLIDLPCTKHENELFSNALSKVSKMSLNLNVESMKQNREVFKATNPKINLLPANNKKFHEFKTHSLKDKIISKQDTRQYNNQSPTLNKPSLNEMIEEQKIKKIENIHRTKVQCCDLIKIMCREIEEEIKKKFGLLEYKVNNNYEQLLKKVQGQSDGANS